MNWLVDFWQTIDWVVAAQIMVALGTIALATVTVAIILQNRKWNKRDEWMRVLPFLTLKKLPGPERTVQISGHPGWFSVFRLRITNVGFGPTLLVTGWAKQGDNDFALCFEPNSKFHAPIGINQSETLTFRLCSNPVFNLREGDRLPSIDVMLQFQGIYSKPLKLTYKLVPSLSDSNTFYLRPPILISYNLTGREIPTSKSLARL